jgi:hypothetical protein
MLSWWRRRKERQQQVLRDADNLLALFGERAYFEALARAQHEEGQGRDSRYWLTVRREIAGRTRKEIGLDTAMRYLSR